MRLSKTHLLATTGTAVGLAALTVASIVVFADDPSPSQAPDYKVSECELGELEVDGESWGGGVESVSSSGEYLLGDGDSMLWGPDDETVSIPDQIRDGLDKAHTVRAVAVNSRGMVIGESYTKSRKELMAWLYHDGEVTELTAPGDLKMDSGNQLTVDAINDDGDIVGTATAPNPDGGAKQRMPLLWESGATEAEVLDTSGDGQVEYLEITDDGTVVGTGHFSDEPGSPRLYRWQHRGEREGLPFPVDGELDDEIEVAGDWLLASINKGGTLHSYRWNMASDNEPSEVDIAGSGIDSRGRVVGTNDDEVPAVATDSKVEELPVPEGESARDYVSTEVGAHSGVLAGMGETAEGDTAVAWRCGR